MKKTITDILFQNPSTFFLALPIVLVASVWIYITRWPHPRPVQVNGIHLWCFLHISLLYKIYMTDDCIQSRRADRFRAEKVPDKIDTVVIGSGSGGSTVANLLAQSGQRVLVLEVRCRTCISGHFSFKEHVRVLLTSACIFVHVCSATFCDGRMYSYL